MQARSVTPALSADVGGVLSWKPESAGLRGEKRRIGLPEVFPGSIGGMVSLKMAIGILTFLLGFSLTRATESSISLAKASFKCTYVQDGERMHRVWVTAESDTISKVAAPEGFAADGGDSLSVQASFLDQEDNAVSVHQLFLRFVNKRTLADNLFLLKRRGREMKVDVKLRTEVKADRDFWAASDVYDVELVMGDFKLTQSTTWTITENMRFAEGSEALFQPPPTGVFDFDIGVKKRLLPEFVSPIPDPEKRAAFPLIVAALVGVVMPLPFLFIGWTKVGVFPLRFPSGKSQRLWLFGFEACVLGHLVALVMFWIQWNIVTTWKVIGALMVPTWFFGRNVLAAPEQKR